MHHFIGSWLSDDEKKRDAIRKKLVPVLGIYFASLVAGACFIFQTKGIASVFEKIKEKLLTAHKK